MSPFRAAVHVHSDWSYDGHWTLENIARAFRRRGYRAVLMAEHDVGFDAGRWEAYRAACANASSPAFLIVPGMEYSDRENRVHVLTWGDGPFLGEGLATDELLERAEQHELAAFLAHPARLDVWRDFPHAWLHRLTGVEVWNRKYDGIAPSATALAIVRAHSELAMIYGLDFHTRRQFFPLRLDVSVDGALDVEAVYAALRVRHFSRAAMKAAGSRFEAGIGFLAVRTAEGVRRRIAARVRARRLSATGSEPPVR